MDFNLTGATRLNVIVGDPIAQVKSPGGMTAAFAERVRAAVEGHSWPLRPVTASFGISALRLGGEGSAEMLARADGALYQSKAAGRNQVTRAADQTAPIAALCSEPS